MKKLFFPLAAIMLFMACDDVFLDDISGDTVSVIAPTDKAEITEGNVSFLWNVLDGAERYRVTVVSPSFEKAATAIKDTIVYPDSLALSISFRLKLSASGYQWSIQAFNQGYESARSVYDLSVKKEEGGNP